MRLGNYWCQYIFKLRENKVKVLKGMFPKDTREAKNNYMLNSKDISCVITNRSANVLWIPEHSPSPSPHLL